MPIILSNTEIEVIDREGPAVLATKLMAQAMREEGRHNVIVRNISGESRQPTDAERAEMDRLATLTRSLIDKAAALDGDETADRIANMPASASAGRQTVSDPINGTGTLVAGAMQAPAVITAKYKGMFPQARGGTGGFSNMADFAVAVINRDPRLFTAAASGMNEGVGADGGFYVPLELRAGLFDASLQEEAIRPRAMIVPMSSSALDLPMFDTTNRTSSIAGLDGKHTGEGTTATTQKAVTKIVTLRAEKYVILVPASMELMADAPAVFSQLLGENMTEGMRDRLDYLFFRGTGGGEPLGILNAPALITVSKESSQAAATFVPENAAKMWARLAPGAHRNAVWFVAPSVLTALYTGTLKVLNVAATDNVGGAPPAFFGTDGAGNPTMMGRPIIVTDKCSQLGTVGDVILADVSRYAVGMRQDMTLAVDTSIGFKESEIWLRLAVRLDGQPLLNTPITPRVGTDTLSPFITLQTR